MKKPSYNVELKITNADNGVEILKTTLYLVKGYYTESDMVDVQLAGRKAILDWRKSKF